MTYTRHIKHWLVLSRWYLSSSFIAVTLYQSVSYHCLITWLLLPWSPMIKHAATLLTLFIFSLFDLRYPDGRRLFQPWQQYIITVPGVERLCLTFYQRPVGCLCHSRSFSFRDRSVTLLFSFLDCHWEPICKLTCGCSVPGVGPGKNRQS